MRLLSVANFSCISKAEIVIDRFTVIIGPQASGKSLLVKLCYFVNDITAETQNAIVKSENLEKLSQRIKTKFLQWFPVAAWGDGKFKIQYVAGNYSIGLVRKSYKEKVQDDIRLTLSEEFKSQFAELTGQTSKGSTKKGSVEGFADLEQEWRLREIISNSYRAIQGRDAIQSQAFVPAGRSFFTSIGKAIAIFEQGRMLDPLTLRFGRMYANIRDRPRRFFSESATEKEERLYIENVMTSLLGGSVIQDGETEYLEAIDGRKIPLTSLSSGQQELLPVATFLPWLWRAKSTSLCYIEEPEAHLFPSTQSKLIEALIVAAGVSNLVITTHSPYVITKVNNLLKAGSLSRKLTDNMREQLSTIVARKAWLSARHVKAYAIQNGNAVSILGKDGFIDADYLDEISSDLSEEFSSMLDLECHHA
jgi:ABC-type cobalamin/Fe3+-siderophores transport system ATPase subunit